jgi:hypothetical protein
VLKITKQAFSDNINRIRKSINEVTSDAHVFLDKQKSVFIKQVSEYQAEAEKSWIGLDNYKEYFEKEAMITLNTSLSRDGFLIRQATTTTKQVADATRRRKINKGMFGHKTVEESGGDTSGGAVSN